MEDPQRMSDYNFRPSINSAVIDLKKNDGKGTFEITVGGINSIVETMDNRPIPFYLTIALHFRRGGMESVFEGYYYVEFDEDRILNGKNEEELALSLAILNKKSDFVHNYYQVTVLYSEEMLDNFEKISEALINPFNLLFQTKIPYINDEGLKANNER